MDGKESVGNSLEGAPAGRCDTGVTTGWTEGKPWEIAWGELRWEGAIRDDDMVHGRETVGNSLGRAPLGRSDAEATIGWTEGKPWEIAWGKRCWEGVIRKRRYGGWRATRGKEHGERSWRRSEMEATRGWTGGNRGKWEI